MVDERLRETLAGLHAEISKLFGLAHEIAPASDEIIKGTRVALASGLERGPDFLKLRDECLEFVIKFDKLLKSLIVLKPKIGN